MRDDERLPDEAALDAVAEAQKAEQVAETTEAPQETEEAPVKADKADTAETEDSPPSEPEKSESKKRRERRMAHVRELEARAAAAEAGLQRIKDAGQGDAPKEEDFDDPIEYAAARAVYSASAQSSERDHKVAQAELDAIQQRKTDEVKAAWAESVQDARSRYQDFNDVALRPDVPVTQSMAEVIQSADNGTDVLYHLGANPAEALRISGLNPIEQVFELGRISAAMTAPKPRTVTQAPEPIKPVNARSNAPRDPVKMSYAEYKEWREKGGGK